MRLSTILRSSRPSPSRPSPSRPSSARAMRPLLSRLLPLMLLVAGCGHRTLITSEPPGAEVRFKGRTVGNTPLELRTVWFPGTRASFQVRMPGHRPATIRLRDDVSVWKLFGELLTPWHIPRWWNGQVRVRHEIVMVRRHGRAGTWRPEDALKKR